MPQLLSLCSGAREPGLLKPARPEPVLRNRRITPAECRGGDTELRTHQGKTRGEPAGSSSHALEEGAEEVDCLLALTHLVLPVRFP